MNRVCGHWTGHWTGFEVRLQWKICTQCWRAWRTWQRTMNGEGVNERRTVSQEPMRPKMSQEQILSITSKSEWSENVGNGEIKMSKLLKNTTNKVLYIETWMWMNKHLMKFTRPKRVHTHTKSKKKVKKRFTDYTECIQNITLCNSLVKRLLFKHVFIFILTSAADSWHAFFVFLQCYFIYNLTYVWCVQLYGLPCYSQVS